MRIALALISSIAVITGPWWLVLICMTLLCLRSRAIEVLFIGLAMDFVWTGSSAATATPWHGIPLFTIAAILLLWSLEPLRRQLLT